MLKHTIICRSVSLTSFPDYLVGVAHAKICYGTGCTEKAWYFVKSLNLLFNYSFFTSLLLRTVVFSDVSVAVPKILDISGVRSKGRQPGEELYSDTPVTNESLPDGKGSELISFLNYFCY